MHADISRHFATIDGKYQVHYRRAGEGPPVVLIHQAPTSSREYIPLIHELAALGHTVIAPDIPGHGLSDVLPDAEWPTMEDYADAMSAFLTEIGIEQAAIFGFHFGGMCALTLALRHPEQVAVVIAEGYVQFDAARQAAMVGNYLAEYKTHWSGAHLTEIWARYREQSIFFPWYAKDAASRLALDIPPTPTLQIQVLDFLRAGNNYRQPYRAAFLFDSAAAVTAIKSKTFIVTSVTDFLAKSMDLMPPTPANVTAEKRLSRDAVRVRAVEIIQAHPATQFGVSAPVTRPIPGRLWNDYLHIDGASLFCRRSIDGEGLPIVMIHSGAGSSLEMERTMRPLIGKRPLLATDLPGNGESENPIGDEITVEAQAAILARAIRAAGYDAVDVLGQEGGGCVGIELAVQNPDLVRHLAVPTLPMLDDAALDDTAAHGFPRIELDDFGAHLIRGWTMIRDRALYSPWFRPRKENVRRDGEPDIAPDILHRATVDLFKAYDIYRTAGRAQAVGDSPANSTNSRAV